MSPSSRWAVVLKANESANNMVSRGLTKWKPTKKVPFICSKHLHKYSSKNLAKKIIRVTDFSYKTGQTGFLIKHTFNYNKCQ